MSRFLWFTVYIVSVCDACAVVRVTDEVPSSRSHSC